jgi:hypothetical protein
MTFSLTPADHRRPCRHGTPPGPVRVTEPPGAVPAVHRRRRRGCGAGPNLKGGGEATLQTAFSDWQSESGTRRPGRPTRPGPSSAREQPPERGRHHGERGRAGPRTAGSPTLRQRGRRGAAPPAAPSGPGAGGPWESAGGALERWACKAGQPAGRPAGRSGRARIAAEGLEDAAAEVVALCHQALREERESFRESEIRFGGGSECF